MNRIPFAHCLILFAALTGAARAEDKAMPLVLEVSQAGRVALSGEIEFEVDLRNSGTASVTLPARPGWDKDGGLEIQVTPVAAGTAARTLPQQPDPSRNTRLPINRRGQPLPAGEALGLHRKMATKELVSTAGEYDVVVVYRGWSGGVVFSRPVRIQVGP